MHAELLSFAPVVGVAGVVVGPADFEKEEAVVLFAEEVGHDVEVAVEPADFEKEEAAVLFAEEVGHDAEVAAGSAGFEEETVVPFAEEE